MTKRKITKSDTRKEAMIKALIKTLGVVTPACKKAGISRETHYKWYDEDINYKAQVDDLKNISIDFVESKMFQQINKGDSSLMKYYLSTIGKRRGYVERQEVAQTTKDGEDIEQPKPYSKEEIMFFLKSANG